MTTIYPSILTVDCLVVVEKKKKLLNVNENKCPLPRLNYSTTLKNCCVAAQRFSGIFPYSRDDLWECYYSTS